MESGINPVDSPGEECEYVEYAFLELTSLTECWLVITPQLNARIKHPDCPQLADISLELDAFYCVRCRFGGRVSAYWVLERAASA